MYKGYRLKIGSTIIPNMLISKGSYSFNKEQRKVREWNDGNGIRHEDNYEKQKVTIQFSIKERNLAEHSEICAIFQKKDNLTVEYWDDYTCEYATGNFKMTADALSHKFAAENEIFYEKTKVSLGEY